MIEYILNRIQQMKSDNIIRFPMEKVVNGEIVSVSETRVRRRTKALLYDKETHEGYKGRGQTTSP